MAIRDPYILPRAQIDVRLADEQWFEVKLDEVTVQKRLPCYRGPDGKWYVEAPVWDDWQHELVSYFIHQGYNGPEIEAFIKAHVLGGSGKVERT